MAFLILTIFALYTVGWSLGLLFAVKSEGPKNPWVPALALLTTIGFALFTGQKAMDALDNPPKLTAVNYAALADGMSQDDVASLLGQPADPTADYNLANRGVAVPPTVSNLLRGNTHIDALNAELTISIVGEPGRAGKKETLGASAEEEAHGLKGLSITLIENENEHIITEGEHWTYENDWTQDEVAAALAEAINELEAFEAETGGEDYPNRVKIKHLLEENLGEPGNNATAQVTTGANDAVRVQRRTNGEVQNFTGGAPEVEIQFFEEDGVVLDADFDTLDHLVIVGFIDNQLVAKVQAGITLGE